MDKPHARWGRVSRTVKDGPVGRSKLYELAEEHKGLFRKLGSVTLVDLDYLNEILNETPVANIGPQRRRGAA
jgi:hypothetical protein